jgi:UDP-N-acetylmuramoylalanine--D-glutamate ligase
MDAREWSSEVNWHDKSILVLGAGDTGVSVVRWAERMGARVRIADTRHDPPGAAELAAGHPGCDIVTGAFNDALFGDAELVVASPGVAVAGPACDPAVARAIAQGKKFVGDVELFAWEQIELAKQAEGKRPKMIGITGSNGKSTVTAMAAAMCRAAGLKTVMAGNIGLPVLDAAAAARDGGQPDAYVLELSSFQLETTSSLECDSAAMLNLSQDHLDRYASMADYARAKHRIFRHARHQVLNREDPASMAMRDAQLPANTFGMEPAPSTVDFGIADGWLTQGSQQLMSLADMPVTGLHNAANALAAFALCRAIGCDADRLAQGLKGFKGLPHRVENVGTIRGVTFYDDSKGTNVGSTVAALNGMTAPVVLIAGGIGKEQDFEPLAEPIRKRARAVVLIGKDARLIESAITGARVNVVHATSMDDAARRALALALPGDAVLLSPACSSFDMFKNYNHRGEVFARCVRDLMQREAGRDV